VQDRPPEARAVEPCVLQKARERTRLLPGDVSAGGRWPPSPRKSVAPAARFRQTWHSAEAKASRDARVHTRSLAPPSYLEKHFDCGAATLPDHVDDERAMESLRQPAPVRGPGPDSVEVVSTSEDGPHALSTRTHVRCPSAGGCATTCASTVPSSASRPRPSPRTRCRVGNVVAEAVRRVHARALRREAPGSSSGSRGRLAGAEVCLVADSQR
jgi:hypothetical protein